MAATNKPNPPQTFIENAPNRTRNLIPHMQKLFIILLFLASFLWFLEVYYSIHVNFFVQMGSHYYYNYTIVSGIYSPDNDNSHSELSSTSGVISDEEETMACDYPKLEAFDPKIIQYLEKPAPITCTKYPLMFETDLDSTLIRVAEPEGFGYTKCCYEHFVTDPMSNLHRMHSSACEGIVNEKTVIPEDILQFSVKCFSTTKKEWETVDIHGFVRPRERKGTLSNTTVDNGRKPNVIILGLDAVSHMNFIRTFPLTYNYLEKNLSAVAMNGFNKHGDNSFPNLIPMLTGLTEADLRASCYKGNRDQFDGCPLIWKNFSSSGYSTVYTEDVPWVGPFTFNKAGFKVQPTDYHGNTLTHALDRELGYLRPSNLNMCVGPRLSFQQMMQLLKKTAVAMRKRNSPYFQYHWTATITHDYLNLGLLIDELLLEALRWFQAEGHFENTIMVLASDHGMRWGEIRRTYQGKMEERLPLLYFILPQWFKESYPKAVSNLITNKDRLTTFLDLHETLKDILDLPNLNQKVQDREEGLQKLIPRGLSLFSEIPKRRTCLDAALEYHWCTCNAGAVDVQSNSWVFRAAEFALQYMNDLLKTFPQCKALKLAAILGANTYGGKNSMKLADLDNWISDRVPDNNSFALSVDFVAAPSNGTFEATLIYLANSSWEISGDVSRTNLYKNESFCISDTRLKKFCYC